MSTSLRSNQAGYAFIIVVAIVMAVLALGGVSLYVLTKNSAVSPIVTPAFDSASNSTALPAAPAAESVDDIEIKDPGINLSFSALPDLKVSAFDLTAPALPKSDIFGGFSSDRNFSYTGEVKIATPAYEFDVAPTPVPAAIPPAASDEVTVPDSDVTGDSSAAPANAANCAGFTGVPSCGYVPAENQDFCTRCKAAGF